MKTRNATRLILGALFSVMLGCGGGGGGGGVSGSGSAGTISGIATKAPINGGTVKVFEIVSSATTNPRANIPRLGSLVAQGTTLADGSYSLPLPAGSTGGALLVQVTGGSYLDEATSGSKRVVDEFGDDGLRAIVHISDSARQSGVITGTVTPFTEMAYRSVGATLSDAAILAANNKIAAAFGLDDIVGVKPLDPNKAFPAGAKVEAEKYALALAGLSQYQKEHGAGRTMSQIAGDLSGELASGSLSAETEKDMKASSNNYAGSSSNPNAVLSDPALNPAAPASISATPAAAVSVAIGGSQEIAASVAKSDGSAVPDGTVISFSTSLGSFAGASSVNVATVGGIARATLSSSAAGAALVTVKSGAANASATVNFFDPNAPASLTLSAGATRGIASGAPVLISATVSRAAGGAVPNGTGVTFSITSGSGSLASATSTVGGVATVLLSSASAGNVTVSASAGSASQSISVPFVSQPTRAIVKVMTTGTLPSGTLIGGINATVTYAGGKGLSITEPDIAVSGSGTGAFLIANPNTPGAVVLGLIKAPIGIPAGEFVTLNFAIAAGNFPTEADFGISSTGLSVLSVSNATIPGMGVAIAGVTIQ